MTIGSGIFNRPYGVSTDSSGYIYTVEGNSCRVRKFDASGNLLTAFGGNTYFGSCGAGDYKFTTPTWVLTDSVGNIYVADSGNNRLMKYSSTGTFVAQIGSVGSGLGQLSNPRQFAFDSEGNMFVAEYNNNRVQKFDSASNPLMFFGEYGVVEGDFNGAVAVAFDSNGNLYAMDYSNHRCQIFTFDRTSPAFPEVTAYVNASLRSTGTTTDELTNITAVEYQVGGTGGTWTSCSASDGAFDEKSEEYSCDMTGLADGVYTVYFRSTDSKTNTSTPVGQSITVDTVLPSKPRITSLGLIFGVPNRDDLTYYFSSTTPRIHGRGEAGARVYFEVNGERYGTTVDENGRWYIRIQSPELERDENTITYYQEDDAGNQSATRTLTLIVGAENFPEWLQIGEEVDSGEEEIPEEETPAEEEEPDEDQGEEQTGEYVTIRILDDNGNPIEGAVVTIDGKTYRSDENGNIQVYGLVLGEYDMTIEYGGNSYTRRVSIDSSGDVVTIEMVKPKISWYWYLLGAIGVIGAFAIVFVLIKRSGRAKPYATA